MRCDLHLAADRSDHSQCATVFRGVVGTLDKSLEGSTPADRNVSLADASGWGLRLTAISGICTHYWRHAVRL